LEEKGKRHFKSRWGGKADARFREENPEGAESKLGRWNGNLPERLEARSRIGVYVRKGERRGINGIGGGTESRKGEREAARTKCAKRRM